MALETCLLYRGIVFLVVQAHERHVLPMFWWLLFALALITVSCDRGASPPLPGSEEAPLQITPGGMTYEPGDGGVTVQPTDVVSVEPAAETTAEPSDDD
jgi:hypothetical protein